MPPDRPEGNGAREGALWVSGRDAGVATADGATAATVRIGGSSGAVDGAIDDGDAAPGDADSAWRETTGASSASQAGAAVEPDSPAAACRCTGLPASGALEVRLGTACGCATTRPAGALGLDSWPSGVTIGGSPAWPGTSARNGAAGATTGGGPDERWIGGNVRHAPVGRIGTSAGDDDAPTDGQPATGTPAPASATEPEDAPRSLSLRPNGHGRRTGLTPPRSAAG